MSKLLFAFALPSLLAFAQSLPPSFSISTYAGAQMSTAAAQVSIATATLTAGTTQLKVLSGFNASTTYYFTLWTADDAYRQALGHVHPHAEVGTMPLLIGHLLPVGVLTAVARVDDNVAVVLVVHVALIEDDRLSAVLATAHADEKVHWHLVRGEVQFPSGAVALRTSRTRTPATLSHPAANGTHMCVTRDQRRSPDPPIDHHRSHGTVASTE